jgi:RNA polymerase sigma-70 factor (ECF subfamily)
VVPTPQQGDADWVSAQISRWGDALVRFCISYMGNPDLAQDVTQETFLRLIEWRHNHPGHEVHPGWLFTVARNVAADSLRDRQPLEPRGDLGGVASQPGDGPLTRLAVRQVLDKLSRSDRECLLLFYFADWPIAEIAKQTGTTPASVKMRLRRARMRFLQKWEGDR